MRWTASSSSASTATVALLAWRPTVRSRPSLTDTREKLTNSPNDAFNRTETFISPIAWRGLARLNKDPNKEIEFNGVYRVSAKDDSVTLLTKELTFPNGIAFSPDEKTLYVGESIRKKAIWMAFPVDGEGLLGTGKGFFDATSFVATKQGLPDGMKVDQAGNVYATGPGGVLVFTPDGTHIGTFATGEKTGNCCWGEDGSTLFITADMYLGRVRLKTRGAGF